MESPLTEGTDSQARAKLELGELCTTPGAQMLLRQYRISPFQLLARHVTGDWGDICKEDAEANNEALLVGARVLSAYALQPPLGQSEPLAVAHVWLITEADRSVTTLLLPEEY